MNKLASRIIPLILIVTFPMSVMAQELAIPPVFVKPLYTQEMQAINQDILAQQEQNILDENGVRDLVKENADLVASVQEKKSIIQRDYRIFSDYEQYNALKETLENYNRQLTDRDERLAKKDEEIKSLRARIMGETPKRTSGHGQNVLDQSVDASFYVGEDKAPQVNGILEEKKDLMNEQYDTLMEKSNDLEALKDELRNLKTQLIAANSRYDMVINEKDRNKAVAAVQSGAVIQQSTRNLNKIQEGLSDKDSRLAELEEIVMAKDREIAALKEEIVSLKGQLAAAGTNNGSVIVKGDGEKFIQQKAELMKKDQSIADLKGQLADALGNKDMLAAQIRLREELIDRQRQRIDLLEQKSNILVGRIKTDADIQELAELKKSSAEYSAQIVQLKNDLVSKDSQKEEVYSMMDKFKDRLKEASDVTDEQAKAISSYREQIARMEEELRISKEDIQTKQDIINSVDENIAKYKATIEDLGQEIGAKDLSISIVQSNSTEKTKVHEVLVEELKNRIDTGSQELSVLKEQLNVAEAKLSQSDRSAEIARLQDMLKASREEIVMVNGLLKDKETYVAKLQKDVDAKGEEVARKNGDLMKVKAIRNEIATVNGLLKGKEEVIVKLQKQIEANAKEFTVQNDGLVRLQSLVGRQGMDIAKLKAELEWKEKEIARLKKQLKDKGIKVDPAPVKEIVVPSVKAENNVVELTAQLKATQQKLQEATLKSDRGQLKEALNDARTQIVALKEELREKQLGLLESDPAFREMAVQVQTMKDSFVQLLDANKELSNENEDLKSELDATRAELEECRLTAVAK